MVALAPSWQREHVAEKFEVLHDRKEEERGRGNIYSQGPNKPLLPARPCLLKLPQLPKYHHQLRTELPVPESSGCNSSDIPQGEWSSVSLTDCAADTFGKRLPPKPSVSAPVKW